MGHTLVNMIYVRTYMCVYEHVHTSVCAYMCAHCAYVHVCALCILVCMQTYGCTVHTCVCVWMLSVCTTHVMFVPPYNTSTQPCTCYTETEHYPLQHFVCKDSTSWHHLNLNIPLAINSNISTCFGVHEWEWEATKEIWMSSHYCIHPIIVHALWMASESATR